MSKKRDITSNYEDFQLLCSVVHERNEICRRRTSIRNKLYVARKAQQAIENNNLIERQSARLNGLTNKSIRFEKAFEKLKKEAVTSISPRLLEFNKEAIVQLRAQIKLNLENKSTKSIPKKYRNMTRSEVALQIAYLERDMAQVTIDQYEFTARTRSVLADLKKKYNIVVHRAHYYNRIDAVTINDRRYNDSELERFHVDNIFEREVLCKEA